MTGLLIALAGADLHAGSIGSSFASLRPVLVEGVIPGVGLCATDVMTVDPAGVGPYAYAWTITDGETGWVITDPDGSSTSFSFPIGIHGDIEQATVKVVVTDSGAGGATCTLTGTARARSTSTL